MRHTKLSSLSCLFALQLSNTHKFVKNTPVTKTVGYYVYEGKHLGTELDDTLSFVLQRKLHASIPKTKNLKQLFIFENKCFY